jgi:signal transduction histidine kinase
MFLSKEKYQNLINRNDAKGLFVRMINFFLKRLSVLSLILIVPGIFLLSWLAWQGFESDSKNECQQITQFEKLAVHRVVDSVGFELFSLHFNFSFKIRELVAGPDTDWPRAVESMVVSYQKRAAYPNLISEVVIGTELPGGALKYSLFSNLGWKPVDPPAWVPDKAILFDPQVDPTVSLERPTMFFPLPPLGRARRVLLVHYRVREVIDAIVPALAAKAFIPGTVKNKFLVSVFRQDSSSMQVYPQPADLVVPLFPEVPFSEWLRTYYDRTTSDSAALVPWYAFRSSSPTPSVARWALQARLLPLGVKAYRQQLEWRNLVGAALVFLFFIASFGLFFYSVFRIVMARERERAFSVLVSHELKTPLTAIQSLSENLAGGYVKDEARIREYGQQMTAQADQLREMIGNILSLASMEKHEETMISEEFDTWTFAQEFASMNLRVVDPERRWTAVGSRAAVRAAVDNLVSNAFKYGVKEGSEPEVEIVLSQEIRWNRTMVGISVVDHGPGLTFAERRDLFRPFRRGPRVREAQIPGSSLGLSLVRATMKHLGGEVQVRTTPGGGLTMTLWLKERPTT